MYILPLGKETREVVWEKAKRKLNMDNVRAVITISLVQQLISRV